MTENNRQSLKDIHVLKPMRPEDRAKLENGVRGKLQAATKLLLTGNAKVQKFIL